MITNNRSKSKSFAKLSSEIIFKITSINSFHSQERGKLHKTFMSRSSRRPSKARKPKLSSVLSNSDSQFVHAFQGKQASTFCLSCDFVSLRLRFPPCRDAEAEVGNGNLEMNHQITADERKIRNEMMTYRTLQRTKSLPIFSSNLQNTAQNCD